MVSQLNGISILINLILEFKPQFIFYMRELKIKQGFENI